MEEKAATAREIAPIQVLMVPVVAAVTEATVEIPAPMRVAAEEEVTAETEATVEVYAVPQITIKEEAAEEAATVAVAETADLLAAEVAEATAETEEWDSKQLPLTVEATVELQQAEAVEYSTAKAATASALSNTMWRNNP